MTEICGVLISDVDHDDSTISVSTIGTNAKWLNSVQLEELITDLELKLQEIKEMKDEQTNKS